MSIIDLEKLNEYDTRTLYSMQSKVKTAIEDKEREELISTLKDNYKTYAGKCYRYQNGYCKVIHSRGENEYRLTILCFPKEPKFNLHKKINLSTSNEAITGKPLFYSFTVETITIKKLEVFTEISLEEFNAAFDEHCRLLKEMEFKIDDAFEKEITE